MKVFDNYRTREISLISTVMGDYILSTLQEKQGFISSLNTIYNLAVTFYEKYKNVNDWDEESKKQGVCDWQAVIILFVNKKLNI